MRQNNKINNKINKRCFSANGFSLLPLALRPRLFCLSNLFSLSSSPRLSHPLYLLVIILSVFTYFTINTLLGGSSSVSATSNLSLNLSINNNTNLISLDIASLGTNGTFRTSDTSGSNITVSTNNYTGYTLGILAKVANSNALNFTPDGSNTTYTIPSITSSVSQSNYSNDTYATTNNLNNTWGYRPSTLYDAVNDTNVVNTDYLPAPTSTETSNQTIIAKTNTYNTTNQSTDELIPDNYNIAIGARIDSSTPPGTYSNTFMITAVANSISYSIEYDQNTEDTVTNMPTTPQQEVVDATTPTITLSNNKPTRDGYAFMGWCTTEVSDDAVCPSSATEYQPGGSYDVDYTTDSLTLYARWAGLSNITFTAGTNIDTMMIADSSENYKPYYITAGNSKTFTNAIPDTKYIVTVIPQANYKLDSWSGDSKGLSGLVSDALLTTNYIVPASTTSTLTATGTDNYNTDYPYTAMQDPTLTNATCTEAMNVTDIRDGKSYTVAPITNTSTNKTYCYMLSNLRLAGSTSTTTVTLDSNTSDLAQGTTFTMPREDTWTDHYCESKMRYIYNEYYYNWYSAMANPTTGVTSSSSCANDTRDAASLGSICPAGWRLPSYKNSDIGVSYFQGKTAEYGLATFGNFAHGYQYKFGVEGYWWGTGRHYTGEAYRLSLSKMTPGYYFDNKFYGYSIRCMRSN